MDRLFLMIHELLEKDIDANNKFLLIEYQWCGICSYRVTHACFPWDSSLAFKRSQNNIQITELDYVSIFDKIISRYISDHFIYM